MELLIAVFTGLLAGGGHVLAGPDHVAAVAPLAIDSRRRTWRTGLYWGLGHSGGVWLLAGLALLLREGLPIESLSTWSERLVGFVLVAIGLWGLRRGLAARVHTHVHTHDGVEHAHIHVHAGGVHTHAHAPAAEPHPAPAAPHAATPAPLAAHSHGHGALGVGVLHGLAGTSHLLGVLPALLLPTRAAAAAYVLGFGLGSIAAMTAFAAALGLVARRFDRAGTRAFRGLLLGSCVAAITVGVFWIASGFAMSAAAH